MGLFSCSKHEKTSYLHQAAKGKFYGGTYRMNMLRGNPNALDPVLINSKLADDISLQIYDRMISLDSNLNIIPELAKSWDISPDGKKYVFHLRKDVFFHDNQCFAGGKGRKLTSADVEYSLSRNCDPTTRTVQFWAFDDKVAGAKEFHESRLAGKSDPKSVSGIKATDDSTIVIELLRPYAPFLLYLCNSLGCVYPKEAVDFYGKEYFRHPVGSGAFIFKEWKDDQYITLKRNPNYWQSDEAGNRLPMLDSVAFTFIKDDKTQLEEFKKGTLDESFTIPTEYFDNIVDAQTHKAKSEYQKYIFQAKPAMLSWFFDFLCTKPPFNNADVRRAFSYAIDREKIVKFVLRGAPFAQANHGISPPVFPGYSIDSIPGYEQNIAKAQEYLAKAGYPNGNGFPDVTMTIYSEPRLVQVAEAIQGMLKSALNVSVNIKILQFSQQMQQAEEGKLEFWGTRWYGDYPDVETFVNLWNGEVVPKNETLPSYPNSTRYNSPRFNELFRKAVETTDLAQRNELYKQAETVAMQDAPAIMLFYEMHYRLLQPNVRSNPLDAMNRVVLKRVWFAEK